jgi:transcription initiation factor IIF auxiliary subunit
LFLHDFSNDFLVPLFFLLFPFSLLRSAVSQSPFEITETGWGEFEAGIRIYFKDSDEQPIDIFHHIRLYSPVSSASSQQQLNQKKVRGFANPSLCVVSYSLSSFLLFKI